MGLWDWNPYATLQVEASAFTSFSFCFFIGLSYVLFLYIRADRKLGRDHPITIRDRFVRVFVCCIFSVLLFRVCCCLPQKEGQSLFHILGFKLQGLIAAIFIPLLLTMVLFMGPLLQNYYSGLFKVFFNYKYWQHSLSSLIWIRTIIVGPLTEEIVYRACMMPVLVFSFGNTLAIFLSPLFFGIAHFHHTSTAIKEGMSVKRAVLKSFFQFSYTTVFGVYSAFLLVRTGNIVSSITCHVFCNIMGFPDLHDLLHSHPPPRKNIIITSYVIGLVFFFLLITPLTSPILYHYI